MAQRGAAATEVHQDEYAARGARAAHHLRDVKFAVYSNSTDQLCMASMTNYPAPVSLAAASACVAVGSAADSANVDQDL